MPSEIPNDKFMTTTILLIAQIFIVTLLIAVILIQKTSSDTLAGLSGGGNSVLSSKTTSNIFSKATVILAIAFVLNSLVIAKLTNVNAAPKPSIVDSIGKDAKDNAKDAKHQHKHSAPSIPTDSE
jgi:preprotein translocase subunit SecG